MLDDEKGLPASVQPLQKFDHLPNLALVESGHDFVQQDVIHTTTGGNFKTDVLSNRMFDENFVYLNYGRGSALAVLIFLGVIPITYYNIRSLRLERKH